MSQAQIRNNPEFQKQAIAGIFNRASATYDHVGPRFFTQFAQRLVDLANITAGTQALDVATGRGAVLFTVADRVGASGHVTGIDIAQDMIAHTALDIKQRRLQNIDVHVMDAETLDFPDGLFDVVFCSFAVFFFPNIEHVLSEFHRVLKPGGQLAISTWGADDERYAFVNDLIRKYATPAMTTYHQMQERAIKSMPNWAKPEGVSTTVAHAGFKDVRVNQESVELFYANESEWLAEQWSHGARGWIEMLPPAQLEPLVEEAFEQLQAMRQPSGIPHRYEVLYTLATKSD